MVRFKRSDMLIGVVSLMWALLAASGTESPLIHQLSAVMPYDAWIVSGLVIGGAQIFLSTRSDLEGSNFHWWISFAACSFWCYIGVASSIVDMSLLSQGIFWITALATMKDLAIV